MRTSLGVIPRAESSRAHLVDIGGNVFWVPLYRSLGYQRVTAIVRGKGNGCFDEFDMLHDASFELRVLETDAELDPYPLEVESADCVVCFELLEHFAGDPMHMVSESNRILRPGGTLCMSTPNVLHHQNVLNILLGDHPFSWSVFTCTYADRHNREYTPFEVCKLLECGGFRVTELKTVGHQPVKWKRRAIAKTLCFPFAMVGRVPMHLREQLLMVRGTKSGPVTDRHPGFLYMLYGEPGVRVHIPRGT